MKEQASDSNTESVYASAGYKRSRSAYRAQCTFEYFISILVSDAYLAKLLTDIGISDTMIGIIESFASAAFLFQLSSLLLVQKLTNVKPVAILCNSVSQVLLVSLYIIPFLPLSVTVKTVLVSICLLLAYAGQYAVSSIIYKWANSFVHPSQRATYSAGKEMISLISGMVFTLVAGQVIDRFEAENRLHAGFLFIAVAGLILSVCNFVSLLLIEKESVSQKAASGVSLGTVFKNLFRNRNFISVIIMTCLMNASRALTIGFMGTFKTKDLLLSVGTVQIINIIANLCRFFVSKPLGRYSDRTSYARGIELALCISAAGFAVNMFTTPKTWWCVVLYSILYNVSIAGTNQNSNNIVYSYVPAEYFVQATAIKNSIGGIVSFLVSLVGAKLLAFVQGNGNSLFGISLYGQQLLSALSLLMLFGTIAFVHFVIAPKNVMHQ